jgi:hypothetical protein
VIQAIVQFTHGLSVCIRECLPDEPSSVAVHSISTYRYVRCLCIGHDIPFGRASELVSLRVHLKVKLPLPLIFYHTLCRDHWIIEHGGTADQFGSVGVGFANFLNLVPRRDRRVDKHRVKACVS